MINKVRFDENDKDPALRSIKTMVTYNITDVCGDTLLLKYMTINDWLQLPLYFTNY